MLWACLEAQHGCSTEVAFNVHTAGGLHGVSHALWLAPFVLEPAAMFLAESTAIMETVSWLALLTLVPPSSPSRTAAPPIVHTRFITTHARFRAGHAWNE